MVPESVQNFEVAWLFGIVVAIVIHVVSLRELRREKRHQANSKENGILSYIAASGIYEERFLLLVQAWFAIPGIAAAMRVPSRAPTSATLFTVGFLVLGELTLAAYSVFKRYRRRAALQLAREKLAHFHRPEWSGVERRQ